VALLTIAFASVARRGQSTLSGLWLLGWTMIALHFAAFLFLPAPGHWGDLASFLGLAALAWGGVLFMWAAVPYRSHVTSSLWLLFALLVTHTLYLALLTINPPASWTLVPAAILFGALPLAIAIVSLARFNHPLRWTLVGLQCCLAIFLLMIQRRPGGADLALDAIFFTVYIGCCVHFWYGYHRATAGAFITIAGFFAWAAVFIGGPLTVHFFPHMHLEDEVWNLPKYVVAVGMIMLLLEDQLEHNKYLALHDELTGLPNRRLFQDRLINTIERARRSGAQAALLLIDLDNFKQVNDTAGHHTGDELLKHVSDLFTGRVRRSDTVARTGGDEFSIILEEPMTRADAARVGKTLAKLLEEPFICGQHAVRVGASVGVAVFPDDAPDAEALRIAADLRMYAGKNSAKIAVAELPQPRLVKQPPQRETSPVIKRQAGLQTAE